MRRRGLLVGGWAVATLLATIVGWAAVQQVTAEVSPSPALPFPSGVALADRPVEEAPAESATTVPPPPPADPEGDTEADDDRPITEAYNLVGGVVTVRYRGATATLVSATPASGFGVEVRDGGPDEVDVRFRSEDHESRLVTRVRDGRPAPQPEERPR